MFLLYQELMEKINEIYIMGGAFWVPGNVTAVSEASIVTPEMVDYIDQVGLVDIVKPMIDYYYDFY